LGVGLQIDTFLLAELAAAAADAGGVDAAGCGVAAVSTGRAVEGVGFGVGAATVAIDAWARADAARFFATPAGGTDKVAAPAIVGVRLSLDAGKATAAGGGGTLTSVRAELTILSPGTLIVDGAARHAQACAGVAEGKALAVSLAAVTAGIAEAAHTDLTERALG